MVKNLSSNTGDMKDTVRSLSCEDAPGSGMATHSSILAGVIWWAMVHRVTKSRHDRSDLARTQ